MRYIYTNACVSHNQYLKEECMETNEKIGKLIGRRYLHGVHDCYSLLRSFYLNIFGIKLGDYERSDGWWNTPQDLYADNYEREGFYPIDQQKARFGDVILFSIEGQKISHCGVYLGNNKILHHLRGRKSQVVEYSGVYKDWIPLFLRSTYLE